MILPQTAIYALRAMASLANLGPGESLRSQELALRAHLPAHYVSKVMRRLVVAKLVSSQKGHGGGFRLAKAPSAITFTQILSAVDVELDQGRCILDSGECASQEPCVLHDSWSRLHEAIHAWANTSTLSDMRQAPAALAAAMAPPAETLVDMPAAVHTTHTPPTELH
ncbi:MAG: HTH-type transcriptional regulator CymR [Planctomycetota bacterium]|jgi:Rrf2 family iron-sulfur cluster assembly transcriptional regulator